MFRAEDWTEQLFLSRADSKINLFEDNLKLKTADDPITHLNDSVLGQVVNWLEYVLSNIWQNFPAGGFVFTKTNIINFGKIIFQKQEYMKYLIMR